MAGGSSRKAELAAPTVKGASEIDVIFSSASSKSVGLSSIREEGWKEEARKDKRQTEVPDRGEAKRKKKNKQAKQAKHKEAAAQKAQASSSSTPTPTPAKCKPNYKPNSVQVVTDTSHTIPTITRASGAPPKSRPPNAQATADDLDRFTDSRATSARKRTEDGLRIFTAAELRLGEGGGGTPDCPFDCQCCF